MPHGTVDASFLSIAYEVNGSNRRVRVSCPAGRGKCCTPEKVGVMLLFLDVEAACICAPGQQAEKVCHRSLRNHKLYDLVVFPLANDVSPEEGEAVVRAVLAKAVEHIKLETAHAQAATKSHHHAKSERRIRVHGPARANGPVGAPAIAA